MFKILDLKQKCCKIYSNILNISMDTDVKIYLDNIVTLRYQDNELYEIEPALINSHLIIDYNGSASYIVCNSNGYIYINKNYYRFTRDVFTQFKSGKLLHTPEMHCHKVDMNFDLNGI